MIVEVIVNTKAWNKSRKRDELQVLITGVKTIDDINQAQEALENMKYNEKIFDAFKNRKK